MKHGRTTWIVLTTAALAMVLAAVTQLPAEDGGEGKFRARLKGAHETPVISTQATGEFHATLNQAGDELTFELTYTGLEGGDAAASHVHLGQKNVAGGVMFFLCGGGGKPSCPTGPSNTITGTVTAANVVGPTGQGITAGQFDEVIRAMRAGLAYANVHNATFPGGEIRGQINDRRDEHDGDGDSH